MNYWMIVTSPGNFNFDREHLKFKMVGVAHRYRNSVQRMQIKDKVVYYIMTIKRFGAIVTITGEFKEDYSKHWTDEEEMWPSRRASEPEIVLQDDEFVDAKKLVPNLSFIENKENWGAYFQGSLREIPEEDFKLIESEMEQIVSERG